MTQLIWSSSFGTVTCCSWTFSSLSRIVYYGVLSQMPRATPWLQLLKACMRSRARLYASLEIHCFLLSLPYSLFWMGINSEGKKNNVNVGVAGKMMLLELNRVTKGTLFPTPFCTRFGKPDVGFQCVLLKDKWVGFYVWCDARFQKPLAFHFTFWSVNITKSDSQSYFQRSSFGCVFGLCFWMWGKGTPENQLWQVPNPEDATKKICLSC